MVKLHDLYHNNMAPFRHVSAGPGCNRVHRSVLPGVIWGGAVAEVVPDMMARGEESMTHDESSQLSDL